MKKERLAAVLLALGLVGAAVPAEAAERNFSDTSGHYAGEVIGVWSGYEVLRGYPDGTFRPDGVITRGELAVVLDRVMGYRAAAENTFSDLPQGEWCTESILRLAAQGIFEGDEEGRMSPDAPITRQEAFSALARVLGLEERKEAPGFADDGAISGWARGYIAAMREAGYVLGDRNGNLRPGASITRAEVIVTLDRMAGFVNRDGIYSGDHEGNLIVNARDVTLKDMTVGGDLIVADGVAEGDVYLEGVTVKGRIILRGCGEDSFHIRPGCQVRNVIVTKTTGGRLRLVNESGETIPMIYIEDGVGGVTLDGWELGDVVVNCDTQVTVRAEKVNTLSVVGNAQVTVEKNTTVARVEVGKSAGGAALTVKGKVTALVNDGGAAVENKGTIGTPGGSSGGSSGGGGGSGSGSAGESKVISEVRLQLLAPRFGEVPDTADVLGVGYTARTEWQNADGSPASYRWKADGTGEDTFTADQAYQAVITLTPISGYRFAQGLRVRVTDGKDDPANGVPAQITASGEERVARMVYEKTEHRDPVSGVSVVAPATVELGGTERLQVSYWNNLLVDPAVFAYQWYRCENAAGEGKTPIPGATDREYTIPAGDTQSEGELCYCCDMIIQGKTYPSGVKTVEVRKGQGEELSLPAIEGEPRVEDGGRWLTVELRELAREKDVSYEVSLTAQVRREGGAVLGGGVDMAVFGWDDIPEEGAVSWRVDLTEVMREYIFAMLRAKLSYDLELGEVTVTVTPKRKDSVVSDRVLTKTFDMTGEGQFHIFASADEIDDELWQGPPRSLQLVIRSSGGTFVDKNEPERNPVPVGEYESVKAIFRKGGDWVDGAMEGHWETDWKGTLYIPRLWLDGFGTEGSVSQVLCTFYTGDTSGKGMNVYEVEIKVGDVIFELENE